MFEEEGWSVHPVLGLKLVSYHSVCLVLRERLTLYVKWVKVAQSGPSFRPHGLYIQSMEFSRPEEWVAFPSFRGSSQPRNRTQVSLIAGGFFFRLSHKGNPRILEWVACPFSSGSSWPRNQTRFSYIAGIFFANCVNREAFNSVYFAFILRCSDFCFFYIFTSGCVFYNILQIIGSMLKYYINILCNKIMYYINILWWCFLHWMVFSIK